MVERVTLFVRFSFPFPTTIFFLLIFDTPWKNIIYDLSHLRDIFFKYCCVKYYMITRYANFKLLHSIVCTDWRNVCTLETKIDKTNSVSKVIWKFTSWVTTFQSIFANAFYCTVYFQRFNAKGIRLKKLACARMQLKRYRLSKETLSLTFYKNRCSSCDDKKNKKPVALLAAGKSPVQLAFEKISIYNVPTDRRARTKKR